MGRAYNKNRKSKGHPDFSGSPVLRNNRLPLARGRLFFCLLRNYNYVASRNNQKQDSTHDLHVAFTSLWGNSPVPSQSAHLLRGITYGPHALCNFNYSMDSIFFNKFTIVLYKKRPDFSGCFCLKIDYNGFCGSQCF